MSNTNTPMTKMYQRRQVEKMGILFLLVIFFRHCQARGKAVIARNEAIYVSKLDLFATSKRLLFCSY